MKRCFNIFRISHVTDLIKIVCIASLLLSGHAFGQLVRVGPVDRNNGFPAWYQDSTGLALDACLPNAQELADGSCLVTPDQLSNPASAIIFPNNFPDEFFYWNAGANLTVNGGRALLVMAVEGAFANGGVVAGDQMVFTRLRIRVDIPEPGGTYKVIHPFGVEEFPDLAPGLKSINFTDDVGIVAGEFSGALHGKVTTFLRASATPGGAPLAPVVLGGGRTFLADANLTTFVTGSPFGTNIFRIEGPNIGGPGIDFIETDQFNLMGRVHLEPIPSPVEVTRATYRRDSSSAQADVFANASPSIGANSPVLSITGTNVLGMVMKKSGTRYVAHPALRDPSKIPASLLVTNSADVPTSFVEANLVDEVQILAAAYDVSMQTLTVRATSGDQLMPPRLIALGLGTLDGTGQLSIQLPVEPQEVTVISSWGGRDTRSVTVSTNPPDPSKPYAGDDDAGELPADVASTINIVSNDTPNAGVTPRLFAAPLHGAVSINPATGVATYTPAAAFSGPDSFTYINSNSDGLDSNVATVFFNVAFVNHAPVATADIGTASISTSLIIDVLANDADPDPGDLLNRASVSIVTPPAFGTAVANADGTITYTAAAVTTNSVSFSYVVLDSHGASSNPATVTVTILSPDVITIITATFRTRGDWRVRGTDSIPGPGNTITIHNGPTLDAPVLGTIAVDVAGAWDFSLKSSRIVPSAGNTISVESTKGGKRLAIPLQITN